LRAGTTLVETERALDKWTIIACQSLLFERRDLVELAIKLLHEAYVALPVIGTGLTEKRLAVVVRLYALGSLAARLSDWEALRAIVLRPTKIHPADNDYVHSSWIRHGHVEAARAGLTKDDDDTGAYLISASRRLLAAQPSMRPDLTDALVPDARNPASDDGLLNSLCQFDVLYCVLVLTEGQTSVKSMYPSSGAFDETRADPVLVTVAGDSAVRTTLFPNCTAADVAEAICNVARLTMQEAFKFGGRWWGPPPSVQAFLTAHGQQEV
jgi:hypothetical protein